MFLLWGALIWLPLLWNPTDYPVLAHRYLMLNGFFGCFACGFLMTAVPKFSQTLTASWFEINFFILVTCFGVWAAYSDNSSLVLSISALQPLIILFFLVTRIFHRKQNPPYSFLFLAVGLILWLLSALASIFVDPEAFKSLHYEAAIGCIILGVGSRLIPGILGHVDIVSAQRQRSEKLIPLYRAVPLPFLLIILSFLISYFLPETSGQILRALVVFLVGIVFWRLHKAPASRSALTWSIWIASWMIALSFGFKAFWQEGLIHMSHAFFISGIVLLTLLVATRVLQSHGPKEEKLEHSKLLYLITFFLVLSAATRVSAFLLPHLYLSHLAYSSFILSLAVIIWSIKYLRFILK